MRESLILSCIALRKHLDNLTFFSGDYRKKINQMILGEIKFTDELYYID